MTATDRLTGAATQRTRPPVLVAGWGANDPGRLLCPECGRTAPAPDTRPTRPERTDPA